MSADVARLTRTVVQLRPAQIGQRARLRSQRAVLRRWPYARHWLLKGLDPESGSAWPPSFRPLDAQVWSDWPGRSEMRRGVMNLLGMPQTLAPADGNDAAQWQDADWAMPGAPLLWRYHLYYWDWAWALAGGPDPDDRQMLAAMWRSWHAAVRPGLGAAWHPYTAALRAWSLCGLYRTLAENSDITDALRADLARHAGFLRRHLETDVGGNHLIKDLKALAGLAVFFANGSLLDFSLRRLTQQLAVQILPDGGHYERTPTYHCQVLGDLIDLDSLLHAAGHEPPAELAASITAMRRWLGVVLDPAGNVPLLNDGFPVEQKVLTLLRPTASPAEPLVLLPETGLARAAAGSWHLLADVGLPCPRELPAHAHADTLSCLLHVGDEPLLVDTGTSTYAAGAVRGWERSTAAHNTAEIDGRDSTEVWGAFRAGRRARVHEVSAGRDADDGTVTISACHDGFRNLLGRPRHHRSWTLSERELRIEDTVTGRGRHRVTLRWHLAPGTQLRLIPGGAIVTTKSAGQYAVTVLATTQPALVAETAEVSGGFYRTVPAPMLVCTLHPKLPVTINTVWRRVNPPQERT